VNPSPEPVPSDERPARPGGVGLWSGFLDRLPAADAVAAARDLEAVGVETVWLQEFSGVDPFVRAALYLGATERLGVALGVATVHARDPEAMVAAGWALQDAFPGRFSLGLGVSHRHLVEGRGHRFRPPIATMRDYLEAMDATARARRLPPRFLGALGPRMVELAAATVGGVHTYFSPVAHTASTRAALGDGWLAPTVMVTVDATGPRWRDGVRRYLELCLAMPNYRRNLQRSGFSEADLEPANDALVDALAVPDEPAALERRLAEQRAAGADHVVVQLVPPPPATAVLARLAAGLAGIGQPR
jgi:probable F420-dependent oxidoreductase